MKNSLSFSLSPLSFSAFCAYLFLTLTICDIVYPQLGPFPIQFSIPEIKIVETIPHKDRDFAFIVPGQLHTYIYNSESEYYKDYQHSYFAITCKKGGWDCMRHYEILANGCIPYFIDIDNCPPKIMQFLPKELIKEAMSLEGLSYPNIDHTKFNKTKYYAILNQILEHTRKYLTAKSMASYLLKTINYSGNGNILYLTQDIFPDYQRCTILIGLKELFQGNVVDFPKIDHIYTNYSRGIESLGGNKGFSFTKILEDLPVNRENIEQRIRNKEFDIIIYGSVHRGLQFHDLVQQIYEPEKIIYICGEDSHQCHFINLDNLFLREFDVK